MTKTNRRSHCGFKLLNNSIVRSGDFIDSNEILIEDVNLTLRDLACSGNLSFKVNPEEFYISEIFSKLQQDLGLLGICSLLFNIEENNDISCVYIIDRDLSQDLAKYIEYDSNNLPVPEDADKDVQLIHAEKTSRSKNFSAYNFFKDNIGKHKLAEVYSKKIEVINFDKGVATRRKSEAIRYLKRINKEKLKARVACCALIAFSLLGLLLGSGLGFLIGQLFFDKENENIYGPKMFESIGVGACLGFLIGALNSRACVVIPQSRSVLLRNNDLMKECEATTFREFINTNDSEDDSEDDSDVIASL